MGPGPELPDVAEVQIECDEKAAFLNYPIPELGVRSAGKTLLPNRVDVVTVGFEELTMGTPEVLVQLDQQAHDSGTSSSSLARSAA